MDDWKAIDLFEREAQILSQIEAAIAVGDPVQAGFILSNGEIGNSSISIEPFIMRLVCFNIMSLAIEVELKDIFTKIDQRLERMEQGQNELKLSVSELKGQINTLDAKVDGLSTRISNQEFLLRTIVGGLILIILGVAAKMFWNFPANP
jgi:hypothetical protein